MMTAAEAQQYCTSLTKKSGSNFYYSFLFLPRARREAMYTVYAFCKEVDNAVDEPPPGTDPRQQLDMWRQELSAAYRGHPSLPVTQSLAEHVRRLSIPQTYFEELIKGVEMDLTITRYATFDALSLYCYRVASVVGLICLHIFGTTSPRAQDYAVNLGMAFQLTNILRDVGTDAAKGRIYVPQEDLKHFHYSEQDLIRKTYNLPFTDLMRFEAQRAGEHYAKAERALHALPLKERRSLTVAEIMRGVYSRILRRIQASEFRVFDQRVTLSTRHRLAVAAGVWLRSRWLPISP
jgi:phytoene synthase